jgi:hypothetical protein
MGMHREAELAYKWLASSQRADGAWASAYIDGTVTDPTLDANFCAYVATGVWHHYIATGDDFFARSIWSVVDRAIGFVVDMQAPDGSIYWARDEGYKTWPGSLLTSSSCIHLSLRCAITLAAELGHDRPDWELALGMLGTAIRRGVGFERRDRYSMDWYYPVLGGALRGQPARRRLEERWELFVIDGRGARCVSDRPWVTTGETCELILACAVAGMEQEARDLFRWVHLLRDADGLYWTGANYPGGERWPDEKTTWSAGSVLLAADALHGDGPTARFFYGDSLVPLQNFGDDLRPAST